MLPVLSTCAPCKGHVWGSKRAIRTGACGWVVECVGMCVLHDAVMMTAPGSQPELFCNVNGFSSLFFVKCQISGLKRCSSSSSYNVSPFSLTGAFRILLPCFCSSCVLGFPVHWCCGPLLRYTCEGRPYIVTCDDKPRKHTHTVLLLPAGCTSCHYSDTHV